MFQDIRKKGSSILVTLMFAAIILTFVISFGPDVEGGCSPAKGYVASVNGRIITAPEFRFAYNNHYAHYQRLFGEFNDEMARQYRIHERTLDSLIADILLAQEARARGFRVSEKELREEIISIPDFQKNGVFDRDTYNQIVQVALNTTVAKFEEKMEMEILAGKLRSFIIESVGLSKSEVIENYINNNEKIDAYTFSFRESALHAHAKERIRSEISEEAVSDYLEKNAGIVRITYENDPVKYIKEENKEDTTFDDVKHAVAKDLVLREKIKEHSKSEAERLLTLLKENPDYSYDNLAKDFSDWSIEKNESTSITKNSRFIEGVGFSPGLVSKLFEKKEGLLDEVIKTEENVYVVAGISKHIPADMAKFESEKDEIKNRMRYAKASELLQSYIDNLREKADIQINPGFMKLYEGER